jgi:hypothetical protein
MNSSKKNYHLKKETPILTIKPLKHILLIILLIITPLFVGAQENENIQAYLVHEDRVKPGMVVEYEKVAKDLVAACAEHNIQELNWMTVSQDDNSYLYITPMEKFAELDVNNFSLLADKMGKDEMTALFERFNPCYDEHGDYVIYLHKDLSYQPGGVNPNPEGKYFRKFIYDYVTPSNENAYLENLKEIKEMFASKNSKMNYRIYSSGFGTIGKYYLIVIEGEDPVKLETMAADNWKMMGEDFQPLYNKIRSKVERNDEKSGWMRADLSYFPKK